ncbi:MAG: dihydrofolate reductase [Pseudomonadota bacterium]
MTRPDLKHDLSVELVVAVARNGVIGRDGDMPWRLSTDLKRFKAITLGTPVIMGRKTFQSIGKPLPGRTNIVITRNESFHAEGAIVVRHVDEALEAAEKALQRDGGKRVCVAGGGEIYRLLLPIADRVHLTHVEAEPDGDTTFPALEKAEWAMESEEFVPAGEKDTVPSRYVVYRRKRAD